MSPAPIPAISARFTFHPRSARLRLVVARKRHPERQARILELSASGFSGNAIARELGCSRQVVSYTLRQAQLGAIGMPVVRSESPQVKTSPPRPSLTPPDPEIASPEPSHAFSPSPSPGLELAALVRGAVETLEAARLESGAPADRLRAALGLLQHAQALGTSDEWRPDPDQFVLSLAERRERRPGLF